MPQMPKELKGIIAPQRVDTKKKRPKLTESSRKKFKKEFLEVYKEDGITLSAASEKVGFSRQVLYSWSNADPDFAVEFEKLKFLKKNKSKKAWEKIHKHDEEYKKKFLELYADDSNNIDSALKKISPKLKASALGYWVKTDFEFKKAYKALQQKTRPGIVRRNEICTAVTSAKVKEKQNKFLQIFTENNFNVTTACKIIGMQRITLSNWCKQDPDFRSALEVAQDEKEDWVEDKLFKLVEDGNMVATIFLSKIMLQKRNLGRRHAYIEQPQKIEGHIAHTHKFDQDQLDAMVRGKQLDRSKYAGMLKIDDPTIIDAEYINANE
jgi:hypothetical protein